MGKIINWDLPVAFYFQVLMQGAEFSFKEVSGLTTELETETIIEGGNNDYQHLVPRHVKHGNLILKRALKALNREDVQWIASFFNGSLVFPISTVLVTINLLDREGEPIYSWNCHHAYPVKWETDVLDSEKNSVLIESLELTYTYLERIPCQS